MDLLIADKPTDLVHFLHLVIWLTCKVIYVKYEHFNMVFNNS